MGRWVYPHNGVAMNLQATTLTYLAMEVSQDAPETQ